MHIILLNVVCVIKSISSVPDANEIEENVHYTDGSQLYEGVLCALCVSGPLAIIMRMHGEQR